MPELPEVETTLRGIMPHIVQQKIHRIIVRQSALRWPIPSTINHIVRNQFILGAQRRGKYLLIQTTAGTLILHLGMSGSLRILSQTVPAEKHDHVDILLANQTVLRFNDPRRFGALLWTKDDPFKHTLLINLGPEPLSNALSGDYLWQRAQNRKTAIKSFIMNSKIVVGIGNIYATEALFCAKLHPETLAHRIAKSDYAKLTRCIKKILRASIKQGGTTLKNFVDSDGKPGYFKLHLNVYGRAGMPCVHCKTILEEMRLGQRSTVYCPKCQIKS